MKYNFLIILLALVNSIAFGQSSKQNQYLKGAFVNDYDTLYYRYLLPASFDESKTYPVMLFLHGAGERGNDNKKQLVHGSKLFLDSIKKYPAIVIFPQCPENSYWSNVDVETKDGKRKFIYKAKGDPTPPMKLLTGLVDSLQQVKQADEDRFYLAGLSMGGMGSFELLSRRPKVFAAAVPICGGGHPDMVKNYDPGTAFWIFHGAKDNVVPPVQSTIMVKALQEQEMEVRYTLFPEANHNSWDPAFKETELLSWLFSQIKNNK